MHVGRNLRNVREKLGLTQGDVGRQVGVTAQRISQIENEDGAPSLAILLSLSRALGVSTDYLLTGQETVKFDATGAIRAERNITAAAKRHLIGLLNELRTDA